MNDTTFTAKEVALCVGWKIATLGDVTWSANRYLLQAPNNRVYQNGEPAALSSLNTDGTPITNGMFRVVADGRETEDAAWNDLPNKVHAIVNGWKAV